ncbi:hypothetical protein DI43_11100 [Geobacillus sp. CAMR12739]|nr:hypothetical protein DI43_11100 [Geobacillus sp. CAMR12739]
MTAEEMNRPKQNVLLSRLEKEGRHKTAVGFVHPSVLVLQKRIKADHFLHLFVLSASVQFFLRKILPFSSLCILTKLLQFF